MAFDYNGAIAQANAIKGYADLIRGYKNGILTLKSSLNDYWKNAMVPQIPALFNETDTHLNNVLYELDSLYNDIIKAANHVRDEEYRQQQEAQRIANEQRRQREAAAAARQVVQTPQPAPAPQPTPAPQVVAQPAQTKSTKTNKGSSKKDDDKNLLEEAVESVANFISGIFR